MSNIIVNQIWQYDGPSDGTAVRGQLHKVAQSYPTEVITIGLPYGSGGSFLGNAEQFLKDFQFTGRMDK